MKDTKRRLETFSFYDRTGMEKHLARMAEQGWLLEKIGNFFWTYRRIEPQTLTFSVCYFPKASAFDPGPSEEQETFYDFCAHTGWTLAGANAQLQVFYNDRPNPIPIETDPLMEVEAVHRTMKRTLPYHVMLLVLAMLSIGMQVSNLLRDPIEALSSAAGLFTWVSWGIVVLLTGVEIVSYLIWHRRAVQAAERGETYASGSHRRLQIGCLAVVGVELVWYLLSVFTSGDQVMIAAMIVMYCAYVPGVFLIVNGVKGFLKRKKVSAKVNFAVTVVLALAAGYAIVGVLVFGVLFGSDRGWFARDKETYQYNGSTFTVQRDELPLTVEDLLDVDYDSDSYSRERRVDETFLLAKLDMEQRPRFDAEHYKEMPRLEYTVVLVKIPFLYELCRDSLLNQWADDNYDWDYSYVPTDAAPWGAVEAFRQNDADFGLQNQYLLCYPDRMVEIQFYHDWGEVTPEQMAVVGEKLGG